MRVARFKVHAVLEQARPGDGTVTIDRGAGTFSVRPARRRRVYTLPLSLVASIVCAKVIKADAAALVAMRGKRPARRRRGLR